MCRLSRTRNDNAARPTSSTLRRPWFTLRAGSLAYGRCVSQAKERYAAEFTAGPQDVEIYQQGTWLPGSLLGWRHESDGSCQVRVRVVVGGVEQTGWTGLEALRLPERQLPPAAASPAVTAAHPASGDIPVSAVAARGFSAPFVSPLAGEGHLQVAAPTTSPSADLPRGGGRRRADVATAPDLPVPARPGRHRAPAAASPDAGRHRAADTEKWALPTEDAWRDAAQTWGALRREDAGTGRSGGARPLPLASHEESPRREPDAQLLTRPMRLRDAVPHARDGRDGSSIRY